MIKLLYFDCDIAFPSPTLAKADDGAGGHGPAARRKDRSGSRRSEAGPLPV